MVASRGRLRAALIIVSMIAAGVAGTANGVAATTYSLEVSTSADRSSPVALDASSLSANAYIFLAPASGVKSVKFYLDDPTTAGTPFRTENSAPWDFNGGEVASASPWDPRSVAAGTHTITAAVTLIGGSKLVVSAAFSVTADPPPPDPTANYELVVSSASDRSGPVPLEGSTLSTASFVFLTPVTGAASVKFYIDDAAASGTPFHTENGAPFDLVGGTEAAAIAWDPTTLASGIHTITAVVGLSAGGSVSVASSFTVDADVIHLKAAPSSLALLGQTGHDPVQGLSAISTSTGAAVPITVQSDSPWLSGEMSGAATPSNLIVRADPVVAGTGSFTGLLTLSSPGAVSVTVTVSFTVTEDGTLPLDLVFSTSVNRSSPTTLQGATVSGQIYPFVLPETGVTEVRFYLDNPEGSGAPTRTDAKAPFDLAGTTPGGRPNPWNSALLPDGPHTVTVQADLTTGATQHFDVLFTTDNDTNSVQLQPGTLSVVSDQDDLPTSRDVIVNADKPSSVSLVSNVAWLKVPAEALTTPASAKVTIDPAGLDSGLYRGTITGTTPGAFSATTTVTLQIGDPGGCSPLACSLIKVATPYTVDFLYDNRRILDRHGVGTGLTKTLPLSSIDDGYDRSKIHVDTNAGTLALATTSGGFSDNNQVNAIGVGFDGPRAQTTLSTNLVNVPTGTGKYEQAGLWFGYDQDNVEKIVVMSTPTGTRIEHTLEVAGVTTQKKSVTLAAPVGDSAVTLALTTDPALRKVTARYRVGEGTSISLGSFTLPGEFFSFDGAGIDPTIGTRSFAGLMATHRGAASPTTYTFDNFAVTSLPLGGDESDYRFDRKSYDTSFPTAMEFGPDGNLYVVNLFGQVRRLVVDSNYNVTSEQVIKTLGQRLALGLTIDPASTPSNVIVWVAHSSPSADAGEVDSGVITKLSGPDLATREDVITGLPRSIANHSTNGIHFGPDGKLYIAQGGNTGAGAANLAATEFGDRAEQPLSNALLVADVRAAGFDGSCSNTVDMYGPAPCDVRAWATGIRNTFNFLIHSNGHFYGPDNGLGVVGSFPPTPTAPCTGFGDTRSVKQGGNNPGTQNDAFNLLVEGGYYGYPNPSRNECVFKDGTLQGVPAPTNYHPPMYDLGADTSTDGVIEYQGGENFCGDLNGDILVSNYSVGDNILRLQLNDDGTQVTGTQQIAGDLQDPLPLVSGPNGTVWVGEFGGGKVTALVPKDLGCWADDTKLPVTLLDAGGTTLAGKIYVVGGKTQQGHQSTLRIYDPATGAWTTGSSMPGAAVENPAVVAFDGALYVFGGATAAFSGATTQAYRYDPGTNAWTALAPLPSARASATVQAVGTKLYVVGGVGASDESLASVAVYDTVTATWSAGPSMLTARDNPSSAVLSGALYVFGGRTKLADGTVLNPTLASTEMLVDGAWVAKADMPTARRTMASGVIDGKALLVGGEGRSDGGVFTANEEYDPTTNTWRSLRAVPTGRHGAVGAVLGGRLHVIGGGPKGGLAFTDAHETFAPPSP